MSAPPAAENVIGVVVPVVESDTANDQHFVLEDRLFDGFANALIGADNDVGPTYLDDGKTSFVWNIDNKYYTAEVHVRLLRSTVDPSTVTQGLSAFVALGSRVNAHALTTLETVWMQHVNDADAEIRLLTEYNGGCADKTSGEDGKEQPADEVADDTSILSWCLEHDFEFVENVAPEDFDAETRLSAEKGYGIARVREALQAHMWPGLKMKGKSYQSQPQDTPPNVPLSAPVTSGEGDGADVAESTLSHTPDDSTATAVHATVAATKGDADNADEDASEGFDLQSLLQNMDVLSRAPNDEDDNELEADDNAFAALLGQMRAMKEQAAVLPDSQRKEYAERVALKFWEAIGGDANENPLADM